MNIRHSSKYSKYPFCDGNVKKIYAVPFDGAALQKLSGSYLHNFQVSGKFENGKCVQIN